MFSRIGRMLHLNRSRLPGTEDNYLVMKSVAEKSDEHGRTPFDYAASKGNTTLMSKLLDCGITINKDVIQRKYSRKYKNIYVSAIIFLS